MLSSRTTRPLCSACESSTRSLNHQQVRHATLLRRPKRPYTFTQLVTLSDGSTFLHRTTSPAPIYRSSKDTKNNIMWNPSSQKLLNVEEDEAGRLRKFRQRFGRGYDAESMVDGEEVRDGEEKLSVEEAEDSLLDWISGAGRQAEKEGKAAGTREEAKKSGKGKGEQKYGAQSSQVSSDAFLNKPHYLQRKDDALAVVHNRPQPEIRRHRVPADTMVHATSFGKRALSLV
ncbi:hypothetical protein BST61_g2596 [Cercospora zeina]